MSLCICKKPGCYRIFSNNPKECIRENLRLVLSIYYLSADYSVDLSIGCSGRLRSMFSNSDNYPYTAVVLKDTFTPEITKQKVWTF